MSLKEILKEIDDQKLIVGQDLTQVHIRARTYKVGQINSAKERLETLYVNYKNEMLRNSVFILVTGEDSKEFADIAEDKFKCFNLPGKSFYKDITKELSPQIYKGKSMSSSVFDIIGNILDYKMKELDILEYNALTFSSKYARVVHNETEMVEVITQAVNDVIGSEVVYLDAIEKISKVGVNNNYNKKLVPIVIHSNDDDFIASIKDFTPNSIVVKAGKAGKGLKSTITLKEITEETVGNALKKIAKSA